jgi:hypothetical protein
MRPLLARERRAAGMVMEGTALEFLPWEAKAFDTLELPDLSGSPGFVGLSGTEMLLDKLNI